jgi:nucleoside-diphosphate-sugar epimerase
VGRGVVERLLHDGHEVVALVRSRARAEDLVQRGVQIAVADISDVDSVFPAGVDAVIHTAFSLFPVADRRINVDGSLRLMRVAARARVRKFVFTSSGLVYGPGDETRVVDEAHPCRPHLRFAKQQRAVELALLERARAEGFPGVILRASEVWGGRGGFFDATVARLRAGRFFLAREDTRLSLTEHADLVEVIARTLQAPLAPGEILNVCTPVGVSTAALYLALARVLGVAAPKRLPSPAIFAAGALAECVFGAVGAVPPLNVDIARLATFRAGPRSITRAHQLLGFAPRAADPLAAILEHYAPTVAA